MHLIVTRPRAQAAAWVQELRSLGQTASALPLIQIEPAQDLAPLHHAWQQLGGCTLAMFVSANAVLHFFAAKPAGAGWPAGVLAGATGPGTSAALRSAGVPESQLVEPAADAPSFDSEALWARLAARDWNGRRVLVVRGEDGRDWLAETLRGRGAEVFFVAAYRRGPPVFDADETALLRRALSEPQSYLWLFSSSEALAHLCTLNRGADWSRCSAVASHPRIVRAARAAGFGRVELAAPRPAAVARLAASIESARL